jgi:hypothetical protein
MKKYKSNYLFTVMFQLCSLFISFFPGIFLMWLLINPNEGEGVLYIFPLYIVLILFFTVLGNAIHFLISLFTKYTVYIDEKTITVQGKRILTQSMTLEDVKYIVFDHGRMTKYGGGSPCSITLFDASYSKSLIINNPSFLLICNLQKRLKHATFKFNNYKWYIIFGCGFTVFSLLICLFT